jgi:tetratricopeptide (TPR) repeat protein
VDAGVVESQNGNVCFTHPLLASVVYQSLGEERHAVHGRIARVVGDPLVRARHLALSTRRPNAVVAAGLEVAAKSAADRGAAPVAAELAEHALRLTPSNAHDERRRRALAAARANRAAGEWTRARTIATGLVADEELGDARAESLVLLAELESVDRSIELLEEALREARGRPRLAANVETRLASATRFRKGFLGAAVHARSALEMAEQLDDDRLRVEALSTLAVLGIVTGDADALRLGTRALELASALGDRLLLRDATLRVAAVHYGHRHVDQARTLLEGLYQEWHERDEPWSAHILFALSWVELAGGRWGLAASHAARAREVKTQYGLEEPPDYLPVALIAVHRGQLDFAREQSEHALVLALEHFGLRPPIHLGVLGLVALWAETRRGPRSGSPRQKSKPRASTGSSRPSVRGPRTTRKRCSN